MDYRVRKNAGDSITECLQASSIIIEVSQDIEIILKLTEDGLRITKNNTGNASSKIQITPEMINCILIK